MISIWYRVLFYDVSILCSVVYNVDIKLGPPPIKSSHFLAELPTSKFRLWELFSLHVFGASRLKFFRTTHVRERCALPTSKFRLWERFALRISGAARLEFSRTPHLRERFALPISKFRL